MARVTILNFPFEITAAVFMHCVLNEYNKYHDMLPSLRVNEAPVKLLRVCREWRSVAQSSPELWTVLQVDFPYFIEKRLPPLDLWLARTGSLPLTLDLKYVVYPDTSTDGLYQILRRHSSQIQDLTLSIKPTPEIFEFDIGPLPSLKKLSLPCVSLRYYGRTTAAFESATQLQNVYVLGSFSPSEIRFAWGSLTDFRADHITLPDCLRVLSQATKLVNCRFGWRNAGGSLVEVPPLLQLKSLTLRSYNESSTDVLSKLTTPALVYLDTEELDLKTWAEFRARSRCALTHLTFAGDEWTSTMYERGLEGLPSLTELQVRRMGPRLFEILRLLKEDPQFLPNLESFTEDLTGMDSLWPRHKDGASLANLVIDTLEARRNATGNTRMKYFELHTTKGFVGTPQLAKRLQALVEDGMKVYVAGSSSWSKAK
ncbi:hypothetical protein R3P38DRAFT_1303333 [Favolaschia claudopus]|uniref:F-box domain-containing protein n=1 Tax=Favolaschia claudopus TaxID=2862362 RepID=A0AAW0B053_9AGAR